MIREERTMSDKKIVYICDGSRCNVCNMDMCMHTTDIEHAENFRRVPGTDVWEETLRDENKTTWIGDFAPYTCKRCGFHVDSKTKHCPECGRKAINYEG